LMALPPWTRELFTGSLDDVAKRLQKGETLRDLQNRASHLLGDLPVVAARGLDRVMQETRKGTEQVRRWVGRQHSINRAAINGSGIYFHPLLAGAPLRHAAVEAKVGDPDLFAFRDGVARRRIEDRLRTVTNSRLACDVLVCASMPAAIVAAGAGVGSGGTLVVPRCCSFRIDRSRPLPELLAATGVPVLEIGSAESCDQEDWDHAEAARGGQLRGVQVRWPVAHVNHTPGESNQAGANPQRRSIVIRPEASFASLPGIDDQQYDLVDQAAIAAGGVTIVPGNRFLGGPDVGLLLGASTILASISATPVWSALEASLEAKAALAITLEESDPTTERMPGLCDMAGVSMDNLQNRAERLATQLAGDGDFESCRITEQPARIDAGLPATFGSRQLRIRPRGDAQRRSQRLESESPALVVSVDQGELVLDLRWIPPQMDGRLAKLLIGDQNPLSE
jgi:L-seryl-tRNA(Ser) seleniumtransferase